MATLKVRLRLSSIDGKKGTIFYQVTHARKTQQITTDLQLYQYEWDMENECLSDSARNRNVRQIRIDTDVALLHSIIRELDKMEICYDVTDIVEKFRKTDRRTTFCAFMRQQ